MSIKPQLYNPTPISDSATQPDFGGKGSAKAYLHYLCSSNHWKQPIYECYNEEGPPHNKLFGSKVSIQSDEGCVIVECFGNNKKSKKSAAEDAAEGALWCLKYIDTVGKIPVALETPEDHDDDEEGQTQQVEELTEEEVQPREEKKKSGRLKRQTKRPAKYQDFTFC